MSNTSRHPLILSCLLAIALLAGGCASTETKTAANDARTVAPKAQTAPKRIPQPLPERQQQAGTVVQLPPQQRTQVEDSVKRVIPEETRINTVVDVIQKPSLKYPTIIISHLLAGRSADDSDSTVRGDYGSQAKMTALSQQRSYEILQSALTGIETGKTSELIANINHGVEFRLMGEGKDANKILHAEERATNVYSTSINLEKIPPAKWQSMGQNAFAQNWEVEYNRIPRLQFGPKTKPAETVKPR